MRSYCIAKLNNNLLHEDNREFNNTNCVQAKLFCCIRSTWKLGTSSASFHNTFASLNLYLVNLDETRMFLHTFQVCTIDFSLSFLIASGQVSGSLTKQVIVFLHCWTIVCIKIPGNFLKDKCAS